MSQGRSLVALPREIASCPANWSIGSQVVYKSGRSEYLIMSQTGEDQQ